MMATIDDVRTQAIDQLMVEADQQLTAAIDRWCADLDLQIRADMAATGPEDEDALDRVPDPDAPWTRITPEQAVWMYRERWDAWKAQQLATLRVEIAALVDVEVARYADQPDGTE